MGEIGFCTTGDILKEVATLIISDITTDVDIPFFLIRALHNKPLYFFLTSLRCYFQYLDTTQLAIFVSPFLYPFIVFALLNKKWRRLILISFIFFPLIFIFNPFSWSLGTKIYIYQGYFMILAVVGFVKAFLSLIANTLRK